MIEETKTKILIIEDEVLIAKDIENTLVNNGYFSLGIAHDSELALDYIHNRRPDLIIIDIHIDGSKDGIEVAEIINEKYHIPFLFLTAQADIQTLNRAKKTNPCGYIVKPFKKKDLVASLMIGLYNHSFNQKDKELSLTDINKMALTPLSDKEFEVLLDIKDGLTNAQIAKKQFLSLSTIKFHSKNIYSKLDVKNRTSAIKRIMDL